MTTDDAPVPDGIGPHEGRELELMLAGEKPLAMFGDAVGSPYEPPEADFAPHVSNGTIVRREATYRPAPPALPCWFVYFSRADEGWRIDAMHEINERLFVRREPTTPEIERQIGRLLGYTETEIDRYLAWIARQSPARTT